MTDNTFAGDPGTNGKDATFNNEGDGDNQNQSEGRLTQEELERILKRDQHAQEHIKKLEEEAQAYRDLIAEYEDKTKESRTVEELLERINQASATRNEGPTASDVNVDDLISAAEERVLSSLNARERQEKEASNFNKAVESLKETYGDKYGDIVRTRASELGLGIEDMDRLAKSSPTALVELVRGQKRTASPQPSSSSVNTGANFGDPHDLSHFSKLRKEDPKSFYSSEVQKQYRQAILEKARKEGRL